MRNEKGMTIVELLAAVTILLIVSSLFYSVLISANKNYNEISTKTTLEQEANIIITSIKNYHQQQAAGYTYVLDSVPPEKKASIGGSVQCLAPLGSSDTLITLEVDNDLDYSRNTPLAPHNMTIYASRPLFVHLKVESKQGQYYEINTVIKRY